MRKWVVSASLGVASLVAALCAPGWSQNQYLSLALSPLPSVPADTVKAVGEAFLTSKDSEFDSIRKFSRTTLVKVELQ